MKNLMEILNEMDENQSINFSKDFTMIQSVVHYVNDHIRPLDKIQFRGGNDMYILDLTSRMLRIFREQQYFDNNNKPVAKYKHNLRQITLFLMLNTNAEFVYDLKMDNDICHLLDVQPKFTKFLLMSTIYGLSLEEFFYEMIEHAPNWYIIQFLDAACDYMKSLKPYDVLLAVKNITRSIYANIARCDYQIMELTEKKTLFSKMFDYILSLMRHFFTPDAEKFEDWKKDQFYKYMGYVLMSICNIVIDCFEIFNSKPIFDVEKDLKVYHFMKNITKLVNNHSSVYSDIVQSQLLAINNVFLSTLESNASKITLDIYMYWVEVDLDEETTLQRGVGEKIYKILEQINLSSCAENVNNQNIIAFLTNISIKPQTLQEKIKESSIGDIMLKLENLNKTDKSRTMYVSDLISRADLVLTNSECLETIENNCDAVDFESMKVLLTQFENDESDELESIKRIIFKSFENLSDANKLDLIVFEISNFGSDVDILSNHEFQTSLVEFFNKNVENLDLKIILQNPKSFYEKAFEYFLTTQRLQNSLIDIFKKTESISENYIESNISEIFDDKFESLSNTQLIAVSDLISNLYFTAIIDKSYFLNQIIYSKIMNAFSPFNEKKMLALMLSLNKIAKVSHYLPDFKALTPPLLIITANVLEKSRWDLIRYSETLEHIVHAAIEFIQIVTKKFIVLATTKDRQWINSKLESMKNITKYYFQKYSLSREDRVLMFDEYIFPEVSASAAKSEVLKFLCENLVRCTLKEIDWLSRNSTLFNNFPEAINLISTIVSRTSVTNSLTCVHQLVVNYIKIVKNKTVTNPQPSSPDESLKTFENIMSILSKLPNTLYDDLFLYSHQLIFDIISINLGDIKSKVIDIIDNMKKCEGRDFLLGKIQD